MSIADVQDIMLQIRFIFDAMGWTKYLMTIVLVAVVASLYDRFFNKS